MLCSVKLENKLINIFTKKNVFQTKSYFGKKKKTQATLKQIPRLIFVPSLPLSWMC